MITMNDLVDLQMQQHFAQEIYRQQIMQQIPDPFGLSFHMKMPPHPVFWPQRPTLPGVEAKLENNDMWQDFHNIGTEMIITKTGRRLFPTLRVSLSGLEPESNYSVLIEMVPIGNCRYKFSGSQWVPAGGAEPQSSKRWCMHPDSPASGSQWQAQPILFNKVKLTNNTLDVNYKIVLASMHKYQPRVHVIRTDEISQLNYAPQQAFVFPDTEFIAVTAYQNDRITKLKIDNNPFAKGFRATGQARCKRKLSPTTSPTLAEEQHLQPLEDNCLSIPFCDSPPIKRLRSNDSANSNASLEEAMPNWTTQIGSSDGSTPPPLLPLTDNISPMRYMSPVEMNLSLLSHPYFMHLQSQRTNNILPITAQQCQFSQQNNDYSRNAFELETSLESSSFTDENDSHLSQTPEAEEPSTDIFIDVVSTSTEDQQVKNGVVGDKVACETPVITADRINFSISAILGDRNVVTV